MKKTILSIAASIFTLSALSAFYSEAPSFVTVIESKSISVSVKGFLDNNTNVRFLDDQGRELVSKKPSKHLSSYIFKLDALPDGNYFIEAEDNYKKLKQVVIISDAKVYIDQKARATYKPVVNIIGKKAKVNILALGEEVTISFSDPIGNTVFEEKISKKPNINKVYDFMHLPIGNYFLNIQIGEASFGYIVSR